MEPSMHNEGDNGWSRREFLGAAAVAGTGALLGLRSELIAAEPPLETTKLRLSARRSPVPTCHAAWYLAEEFLRSEGFTDVQYIPMGTVEAYKALASGEVHLGMGFSAPLLINLDAGDAIVFLGGGHVGCFELFGTDRVRTIRDLKGKTVAVPGLGSTPHVFLSIMAAYVGLDPRKDINWVSHPPAESIRLLSERKIDAFMAFPPEPQEIRAKKIGHVVVNAMMDRPWSQYFCCLSVGNRDFVRKNPVATKRWLRAVMKAADVCAREPERAARFLVDKGYTKNYDYALQTVKEIDYSKWRDYDAEDTLRFYGLRLHEVGMIKTNPQKIIAQGTDWRFLKELKKELKG
jgi:NitT/TauT family transport system substrate-binding protein